MKAFAPEELAAWLDAAYDELCDDELDSYELADNEFTGPLYAEAAGMPESTANHRLKRMREAGRIEARQERIGRHWVWIYSMPDERDA